MELQNKVEAVRKRVAMIRSRTIPLHEEPQNKVRKEGEERPCSWVAGGRGILVALMPV